MRVHYTANAETRHNYRAALNDDLGIFHVQSGAGIGGFLAKLFKRAIPIGKSILHHGFEAIKPELKKVAAQGVDYLGGEGVKFIKNSQKSALKKIGTKRKRDASKKVRSKRKRDFLS